MIIANVTLGDGLSLQCRTPCSLSCVVFLRQNVHTSLTEEYGVPVWGSYLLFILGTVIIGALLGLIFVCCIDICCAQKSGELPPEITKKDDDVSKLPSKGRGAYVVCKSSTTYAFLALDCSAERSVWCLFPMVIFVSCHM